MANSDRGHRGQAAVISIGAAAVASAMTAWATGVHAPSMLALSAVAGGVLLAAGFAWPAYAARRAKRADAAERVEREFSSVVRPLPSSAEPIAPGKWVGRSPSELLRPGTQAVPFFGRRKEMRGLAAWASSTRHGRVRLILGPGGTGKTRLAIEFARSLRDDPRWREQRWRCGYLQPGAGSDVIAAAIAGGRPTLLVIDYAEGRVEDDTAALFAELANHDDNPVIRVLLLARSAGEWWDMGGRLWSDPGARSLVVDADAPTILEPLGSNNREYFRAAMENFAAAFGIPSPAAALGTAPPGAPILLVHTAALVAVLQAMDGVANREAAPDIRVVGEILGHESKYWMTTAAAAQLDKASPGVDVSTLRRAVAAIGLLGAHDPQQAAKLLQRLPALAAAPTLTIGRIVRWLYALYPPADSDELGSLQPDLLLEHLVATEFSRSDLVGQFLDDLPEDRARYAFGVLTRALDHYPDQSIPLIRRLLAANVNSLMLPAVLRVRDNPDPTLAALVADVIVTAELSSDKFSELARYLGTVPSLSTSPVFLALHARIGESAASQGDLQLLTREADLLYSSGCRLNEAGQFASAVPGFSVAVKLYREAYAADAGNYREDLALALTQLSASLDALERCQEALVPASEAVELYRAGYDISPDAYRADLASALASLASIQSAVERCPEALVPASEAVEFYRAAHDASPDRYRADLARVLVLLGAILRALGRRQEALPWFDEAVVLYRAAYATDPSVYGADLAQALVYLGTQTEFRTDEERQTREAAIAAQEPLLAEAVELYRRAYGIDPDLYRADLALALTYLGTNQQFSDGPILAEAVRLYRDACAFGPDRHRRHLRLDLALANLWARERCYVATFRWRKGFELRDMHFCDVDFFPRAFVANPGQLCIELARALTRFALIGTALISGKSRIFKGIVELWRKPFSVRPEEFRLELAGSLYSLGVSFRVYPQKHVTETGGAAFIESAKLCLEEAFVSQSRDLLPDLLYCLGRQLSDLGFDQEALPAQIECVRRYRQIDSEIGDKSSDLASALSGLAKTHKALNHESDASVALTEAAGLYRDMIANPGKGRYEKIRNRLELAGCLSGLGDLIAGASAYGAEKYYRDAMLQYRSIPGIKPGESTHRIVPYEREARAGLAATLANLAVILDVLGRSDEAIHVRQEADAYGRSYR